MLNEGINTIAPFEKPSGSLSDKSSEIISKVNKINDTPKEKWSSMMERYDPIGWDENSPGTTMDLHIPEPESLIKYRSDQLTQVLKTEQDLQENIRDISLLTRIAEANNIEINTKSPLYKVISQMSKIPSSEFEDLQYPEIFLLAETSQRAANLLLGREMHIEARNLRGDLVDLANRAYDFLSPVEYDYEELCTYFDPYHIDVYTGEEELYNHTNTSYEDDEITPPPSLTKYNIATDDSGNTCFKSCGLFVKAGHSETASIDFTPFNAVSSEEINPTTAMAMAFMGMENFLHALEEQQLDGNNLTSLAGWTNPTMAQFASRFGFKVQTNGIFLSREEIKAGKIDLFKNSNCYVKGLIKDIREEVEKFKRDGFDRKLIARFNKAQSSERS